MKPITSEWVDKAEADLATARRKIEALDKPNYDAVCFHTQQCAEKYLKACLQEAAIDPNLEALRPDLNSLSAFAVEYRYPGESAEIDEAREALGRCRKVRQAIRQVLSLQ